ncbi:hypothetical protein COCSUDRAFT_66927 [Coccomyxa subellipsoidea C-169]|uniref:Exostosin GT47 domain-containing protein n=1 Tax=Coccomyxa subellipsoidea (strain C-169) TaxID=574566 RepID=I0YSZ9_COCSC|nr:hypothetical protein COCSUDRAFT_66927 [Coccomyxa subellipsoidea C-169]EIE21518.1 hypothetical protein COCSUDRAFT_66927 [Coccomyxa subellipsoidea C-169]|eukprot:XP_005646062.1 hypothetical protein COCSUDRAFT_66927 [Coccomyxa subellipsoidea C-169]
MKGRSNSGACSAALLCILSALTGHSAAAEGGTALTLQQTDPYHAAGDAASGNSTQQSGALSTDQQLAASLAQVLATALQHSNATAGTLLSLPQQSVVDNPTEPQAKLTLPTPEQQKPEIDPLPALDAAAAAGVGQQQLPEQAAAAGGTGGTGGSGILLPAQALDVYPGALDGAAAARLAAATAGDPAAAGGEPAKDPEGTEGEVIAQHAHTQSELLIQTDADGAVTAAAAISQTTVGNVTTGAELVKFERGNDTATLGVVRLLPAQMQLPYPMHRNATEAELRNVSSLLRDRSAGGAAKTGNRTGHILRKKAGKEEGKKGQPAGAVGGASGGCHKNQNAPCKFFLLDVSEIAVELGFPSCSVDQFVADPESGMTLPNPAIVPNFSQPVPPEGHKWIYPYTTQPHYLSQNAGPWYVYHTLRNSVNSVRTIAEADVVYVYDYCYIMWALGDHHARDHWWLRENYNPTRSAGHYLLSSYRAIMGLPRWRRTGGRDFVFYHSHPGFEWDDLAVTTAYQDMMCVDFQWATVLAVEQGQRWRCPSYSPRSTIVVPYSSTESINTIPLRPDGEKESLLFFRGKCDPAIPSNMGKLMRSHVVRHLREGIAQGDQPPPTAGTAPEINVCCHGREAGDEVKCTEREFEQNVFATQKHRSVLEGMANSAFCLILPGNSQSSQRLTEAFLAGCIPVFIGPPWHSLPLTQKAEDRFSPAWWFADIPATSIIPLRRVDAVLPYLRQMPNEWMEAKRRAVMKYRSLFIYTTSAQIHEPSASDAIVDLMCSYAKLGTFQDSDRH